MTEQKKNLNSCIIAAAGVGSRMGRSTNKQFVTVAGVPVLARTLKAFEECPLVHEIVVVINVKDRTAFKKMVEGYSFLKVAAVVEGAETRQKSVYNGLCAVNPQSRIVLIHDGARPFIDRISIENCITAAQEYGACCAAVPAKDTIKVADAEGFAEHTPDRSRLWAVQTPQCFKYETIMHAHRKAVEDSFTGSDDAMLVERTGSRIKMVMCSYYNIKITTPEDLILAESIAKTYSIS